MAEGDVTVVEMKCGELVTIGARIGRSEVVKDVRSSP
jgi:hypothetical protein